MAKGRQQQGNMQQMLAQAQRMQMEMEKKQLELQQTEFSASSGGNMVTATCNGGKELLSIAIAPEVVDPDDVEMLQDLILSAVNAAMTAADEATAEAMGSITAGIPGMGRR